MTERRADEATRDATMALKCHYMADKIGEPFVGKVTAVASFGLFVELQECYVDGLVHVASLGDDYFYYEPFKHRMIGERTGKIFQLGDTLGVRLTRVDVEDKKIDLEILDKVTGGKKESGEKRPGRNKGPKKARKPSKGRRRRSRKKE